MWTTWLAALILAGVILLVVAAMHGPDVVPTIVAACIVGLLMYGAVNTIFGLLVHAAQLATTDPTRSRQTILLASVLGTLCWLGSFWVHNFALTYQLKHGGH